MIPNNEIEAIRQRYEESLVGYGWQDRCSASRSDIPRLLAEREELLALLQLEKDTAHNADVVKESFKRTAVTLRERLNQGECEECGKPAYCALFWGDKPDKPLCLGHFKQHIAEWDEQTKKLHALARELADAYKHDTFQGKRLLLDRCRDAGLLP